MSEKKPATDLATRREELAGRARSGARWFYWIAGLSLVNSLIVLFSGEMNFIFGLGITQVVDAIAAELAAGAESGWAIQGVGLALSCGALSVYLLFGWLASRQKTGAFVTGMVFYALDGLIFVAAGDFLGAGLHVVALVLIGRGLKASVDLRMMLKPAIVAAEPEIPDPVSREIDAVIDSIVEADPEQETVR